MASVNLWICLKIVWKLFENCLKIKFFLHVDFYNLSFLTDKLQSFAN